MINRGRLYGARYDPGDEVLVTHSGYFDEEVGRARVVESLGPLMNGGMNAYRLRFLAGPLLTITEDRMEDW